ncbi:MAG: hypothetical protein WC438_02110 [Candidatus Pacearchaeota archaeon]
MKIFKKSKKGMEMEVLAWWILGLIVFVVIVFGYIILSGKGGGMISYLKNLFRGGIG